MRRTFTLALVALAIGCTRGPKGLSNSGYRAAEKAAAVFQRAYEYRAEESEFYEPRLLDAQRAVDAIPGKDKPQTLGRVNEDWAVGVQARACLSEFAAYRLTLTARELALKDIDRGERAGKIGFQDALAKLREADDALATCLLDLKSYLGP